MDNQQIAFIGCGNMGSSLMGGLIADGYNKQCITGCEPQAEQREKIVSHYDVEIVADAASACKGANIIVLAVKPQIMAEVCREIRTEINPDSLIISIAAGIQLDSLANWLGEELGIVRAMPNTPALIGAGASALVANKHTSDQQRNQAEMVLRSVGITLWLEKEDLINAVTAVSGSGPAYFFLIIEIMQQVALELGLNEEQARLLTLQTALGAARMALESEVDAAQLRRQVTSPGGTTEQALGVMMDSRLDKIFSDALKAARDQSIKLAEQFGTNQTS